MSAPRLSIVVVGSRPEGPPPELFGVLAAPLAAGTAELLLLTPRELALADAPGVRVLRRPAGSTVPALRLAGIRAAAGELIAVTEDFCVPAPSWAAALLEAHEREPNAVVGGPVARRSGSAADWALTLIEYGRFFGAEPAGRVANLPSINVAYPRAALLAAIDDAVDGVFEVELHARLTERGVPFYRVPDAVMFDHNSAPVPRAALAQYHHGRLFGGRRVDGRGLFSRLKYGALSPAVPAVLFSRIAREVAAAGRTPQLLRALPALSVLLGAWALGEGVGSLLGPGQSGAHWT